MRVEVVRVRVRVGARVCGCLPSGTSGKDWQGIILTTFVWQTPGFTEHFRPLSWGILTAVLCAGYLPHYRSRNLTRGGGMNSQEPQRRGVVSGMLAPAS